MPEKSQSMLTEILPPAERAVEHVVARYQRVAPAVTRFARSLAGNDELRVRLGAEASSSPDEVVLDPRVFQAAYARSAPVTPEEVALAAALHEAIHLVSTDLDERRPIPTSWLPAPDEATAERGEEPDVDEDDLAALAALAALAGVAKPDASPAPDEPVDLLVALDRAGGPPAASLFFALEDARQESRGMHVYPGARSVLADLYRASVTPAMSSSRPLGQFGIGCFLLIGDYAERREIERRVDPRVAIALADAKPFLDEVAKADDPWDVADLALQLLSVAKVHGLGVDPQEDETTNQAKLREEADGSAISDGLDRVRLISPIVQDADGYERTKDAAEARAGQSDRKAPSEVAGHDSTDQLLRVSQAPTVYLPTGQAGKLIVSSFPEGFRTMAHDGRQALAEAAARWGVAQRHVSGELFPLFAANQRRGLRSGYDAGDLSPHAALFLAAGLYQRMYERRALRTRRNYAVSLLVDGSASMLQPQRSGPHRDRAPWALAAATLGAWTLAELCDELQIDFEVALFNRSFAARHDDTEWSYSRRRSRSIGELRRSQGQAAQRLTSTVNHYLLKSFAQRWRDRQDLVAGLFWAAAQPRAAAVAAKKRPRQAPPVSMFEKAANVDEFNLAHAAERMAGLGAQVRVLVVLADGMTRGSIEALTATAASVERQGTTVLGIGIGDQTVETTYGRHQVVGRPDELARAMVDGVRDALRRSLAMWGMDAWWLRPTRAKIDTTWKEQASV